MWNLVPEVTVCSPGFPMRDKWIRFSSFVPRLYNFCTQTLQMPPNLIMPSRAFCSDESQGYPIILLAKQFGIFPFDHGRVGGIVATNRNGPHAHHGHDCVLLHASHVAYDPQTMSYGSYRRVRSAGKTCSSNCGKLHGVVSPFLTSYKNAGQSIVVTAMSSQTEVSIDTALLQVHSDVSHRLRLRLDQIIDTIQPTQSVGPTSHTFLATDEFHNYIHKLPSLFPLNTPTPIGKSLTSNLFSFERSTRDDTDDSDAAQQVERNLLGVMPQIVCDKEPLLLAAQANTQAEFNRVVHNIRYGTSPYRGRKFLFLSGLNVDVSPPLLNDMSHHSAFGLTKFVPWAAYYEDEKGVQSVWSQAEVLDKLNKVSGENKEEMALDNEIDIMKNYPEIPLP